jgi:hypothetical protein
MRKPGGCKSLRMLRRRWESNMQTDVKEVGCPVWILTSPYFPDMLWGPPSLLSNDRGRSSQEVKQPGREADLSPPTSTEVKNTSIHTSTPPYVFMA